MKTIIAGSRNFNDYNLLVSVCKAFKITEIVSGCARGADMLGERYAGRHAIPIKKFPANWDSYGKRAGYIRNEEMAKYADTCIAFWDGSSKGTKHMIDLATKYNLELHVIKYLGEPEETTLVEEIERGITIDFKNKSYLKKLKTFFRIDNETKS